MKKNFLTVALFCGIFATSCASAIPGSSEDKTQVTGIDTLSYITGYQVAQDIEGKILPELKLDYETIVATIDKLFQTNDAITVGDITITPQNIGEIGRNYFTQDLYSRVQAAMTDTTGTTQVFNDPKEREIVSTLIGADYAYNMAKAPFPLEKASFLQAIAENHNGNARFTLSECNDYMNNYFTVVIPQNNKRASEEWLNTIANEDGVKKTESGIYYKIISTGDMNIKANSDEDVVKVLYTGTTREGKVFDSNRWADMPAERKQMISNYSPDKANADSPIEFPLNRVIKGWTEGMKLIGKGGRIILWIPAELAYGERGAGNDIGPNEALRFDVELLEVTDK